MIDSTPSDAGWSAPIRAGKPLDHATVDWPALVPWFCASGAAGGLVAMITGLAIGGTVAPWLAAAGVVAMLVGVTVALRRVVGGLSGRVDAITLALQASQQAVLAGQASLAMREADMRARADRAAEALERTAADYAAKQARLHQSVTVSGEALRAMQEQLARLAGIKPAQVEAVLVALRGQARGLGQLHGTMEASVAAHDAALRARAADAERLVGDVGERLHKLVGDVDAALRDAAARTGEAAVRRVGDELAPVGAAAADHAEWLRASLARMRGETEALIGAQQAVAAVRSVSGEIHPGPPVARLRIANARDLHAVLSTSGYVPDPD